MIWRNRLLLSLTFCVLGISSVSAANPAAQNAAPLVKPSEAATISEFVAACDRDVSLCEFKMRMVVLDRLNTRDAPSICLNDAHPRTQVIAWLKAHPETLKMATDDGLFTAYQSLYSCSRP